MKAICRMAALVLCIVAAAWGKDKKPLPVIRWAEEQPGCTFSRDDDGKDRYGLWKDDLGITLAVDTQELQKTHHRPQHLFTLQLTFHYRGNGSLQLGTARITLEFLTHAKVVHNALDPDNLSTSLQNDANEVSAEFERDMRKHPNQKEEQKQAKEELVHAYQKDVTEMQEFVTAHGLRPATLDPGNREVSGWLFFSTEDKWIGAWKKQEQFVFRVPVNGMIFEFPFRLPPAEGEMTLRKRP